MSRKRDRRNEGPQRKLKRSTLAIGLIVGLAFSILIGITAGARGLGSIYPQLNLIAKPLVCSSGDMTYSRSVSDAGTATYYSATWSCDQNGEKKQLDSMSVFVIAGIVYGLVFFVALLLVTHFYWSSSIGPAKNGGPELW